MNNARTVLLVIGGILVATCLGLAAWNMFSSSSDPKVLAPPDVGRD